MTATSHVRGRRREPRAPRAQRLRCQRGCHWFRLCVVEAAGRYTGNEDWPSGGCRTKPGLGPVSGHRAERARAWSPDLTHRRAWLSRRVGGRVVLVGLSW